MKWCSWKLALHRVLHELRDSDCSVHGMVGLRFFWSVCVSKDCLGTDETLRCLLDISCALGPRSCVCHHQFLIAICTNERCFSFHREPVDAPSVGDGDTRASVHPGPKRYEALGEGLGDLR